MQTPLKNNRFDELETLRKKLDVSFGVINERVVSWLPPQKPEEKEQEKRNEIEEEEGFESSGGGWLVGNRQRGFNKLNIGVNARLKRKLTSKHNDSEDDDNINNTNVKYRRKATTTYEDDEQDKDSKFVAIVTKNRNKKKSMGCDFLSVYLSERNSKKKKKNNQHKKNDDSNGHRHSIEKSAQVEKNLNQIMEKKKESTITTFITTPLDLSKLKWKKTITTMENT
ncbi:10202_t:CDS:2 [Ambispora leptoticha]|uniref:10202_t:CDS:1 n=1 Tax=Ambispora leptoticha TaxID=144679 RepID=A0A9N8WJK9_9GLOM|nr:10202_t:CDS:2 [Ambispora leptoticha]